MPFLVCPVTLTPEELAAKAHELASAVHEHELVAEEKKEADAEFRARAKEQEDKIHALGKIVRLKAEEREVEVKDEFDALRRVMRRVRVDTAEVVEQREATVDEVADHTQRKLDFPDDGANDPANHATKTPGPNFGTPGVNMPAIAGLHASSPGDEPPHEPSADERKKARGKKTKAGAA